ncbi:hypothetical protein BAE44_0006197 [Dichanthelium oligosanthes]|uniref:DUF6598 domain-containing protein n=1 Tax=Dichanthelium oligosanthes TaxID=888268 RepID=A0A1E5W5X2_9POAL|nr:hypothetical protein BAE44_0006197 [Dichanthelium oligosanthes]
MAPMVAELLDPNTSGDLLDPGFASALGPEHRAPVGDDDDEELLAVKIAYGEVEDDPIDYETTCPGQNFTEAQEEEISLNWIERWSDLCMQFSDSCDEILSQGGENPRLPPGPLKVLPETTYSCITRGYCYHREYMTSDTSQTKSVLGFRIPQQMMQVFSLRLSSYKSKACPISIYGIFAVRDDLEPLRNYAFNRSRDNPVMIHQDSVALPLCSPCRGMYVLDRALLEVDLWVKKEGDGSTDEQLLSVYVEIDSGSDLDEMFTGRIHSEDCILDMDYMFLAQGVEAVIQVFTVVDSPHHVKFIASSSCFDKEIVLFEGKCVEKGELFMHTVAVKAMEKLSVSLEWENLLLEWTFQDGALGALSYPDDDSIPFYVRVFFAPKNVERRPSRYRAWEKRCRNNKGKKLPVVNC